MERTYYVYIIEHLVELNKLYVGITYQPEVRWKRHKLTARSQNRKYKQYIHHAMAVHGENNFSFTVIEAYATLNEARCAENYWVLHLSDNNFHLYNLTEGGDDHPPVRVWTDEHRKAASELISGEKNYFYGKQLFGEANGNYGKKMQPHVKEILLQYRAKLTPAQVQEIRELYATGNYTQTELCRRYDMSCAQIHRIVKRKRWQQ